MGVMDAFRWEKKSTRVIWVDTFVHITASFVIFGAVGYGVCGGVQKRGKVYAEVFRLSMASRKGKLWKRGCGRSLIDR